MPALQATPEDICRRRITSGRLRLMHQICNSARRAVGIRVNDWKAMEEICGQILIVDDDPGFRGLMSMLCARAGYDYIEA